MPSINNISEAISHFKRVAVEKLKSDYPCITIDNLMKDEVYSSFFLVQLKEVEENLANTTLTVNQKVIGYYRNAIKILVSQIETSKSKDEK